MNGKQVQFVICLLVVTMLACSGLPAIPIVAPLTATASSVPPTLSPTVTNTAIPTSSPTATPTSTPSPTPTTTPIPAWVADFAQPILEAIANRPPNYTEDFSNSTPNWDQNSSLSDLFEITNGVLIFTISSTQQSFWKYIPCCGNYQNIVLIVDIDLIGIHGEGSAGINFQKNVELLEFMIKPDGSWSTMYNNQKSNAHKDLDNGRQQIPNAEKVTVMLIYNRAKYAFYINDTPVSYGNTFSEKTRTSIAFNVSSYGNTTAIGKFDNINIWSLDGIPNLP